MNAIVDWSASSWRRRHEHGYFPTSVEHSNWKIFTEPPSEFHGHLELKADDDVVEIGCGYGEWMIPISRLVRSVTGCDIHPTPIQTAIAKFDEYKRYNCSVGLCYGSQTPFGSAQFSVAYSISVFQHLPKQMAVDYLWETLRLLQPGGRFFHHFRRMTEAGEYPKPAEDIKINHTGDFSCGWTREEIEVAASRVGMSSYRVVEMPLFFYLVGEKV